MKFSNPYWSKKSKIQMLEYWIIVHSLIYYQYDMNIVSDRMYDNNCMQLVQAIEKYPEDFKQTEYYYCFEDFDGSTGFDLHAKLTNDHRRKFMHVAEMLIQKYGR